MERFGSELIFISRIIGHGKRLEIIEDFNNLETIQSEIFKLNSLSISNMTYVASGMNTCMKNS